jgi:hypothetical protein
MSDPGSEGERSSFFDLYDRGLVGAEAIDDWVGRWHDRQDHSEAEQELHAYLGLSLPEYQVWVYDPGALPYLLAARRSGHPLDEAVEERLAVLGRAGDQADRTVIRGLRIWLDTQARPRSTAA